MSWLVPRSRLTPEQIRAVELPPSEHRLLLGGPGSGKTQVLLHRADYLRQKYSIPPDRFRIFVYTNVLTEYIASGLSDLDIPPSSVSTLASWALEFSEKELGRYRNSRSGKIDWPRLYKRVADYAEERKPSIFDFVLVDEGQDLDKNAYRLLRSISKHVTVCMDHKQQIYEDGSSERTILAQLGIRKRNLALLDALRCSPYVINVAAALVQEPQEGKELVAQTRTIATQRETPVVYLARNFDDEMAKLVDTIRTRQIAGDRIGILFPQRRQVVGFANGLSDAGLMVESQVEELDFLSSAPKLLTYHSAKGLTFDSVLMPRLVEKSFPYSSRSEIERLLFVGVSRAVKWAYFSTDENSRFAPLDRITALEALGQVTVLRASQQQVRKPIRSSPATTVPDDDLLDIL